MRLEVPGSGVAGTNPVGWDYYLYESGGTYYAVSNGGITTSDADFVTLFASVLAANKSYLLGEGTFSVAAGGIVVSGVNGVRLEGINEYSTILEAAAACPDGVLNVRSDNVVVRNLTVDGNAKATTVGLSVGSTGDESTHAYHGTYEAIIIKDCTTAGLRSCDDVNYTNFVDIRCADSHVSYGLQFFGDDYSNYNSGQQTFVNCVFSGPDAAVIRTWTAGGTCKGIAFVGCDFQDGHSGVNQVDCTGMYNVLFDRCIFETSESGDASESQIRLDSYGVTFNCCSFAARAYGTTTFISNGHSYSAAGMGGYTFIGTKLYNYTVGDVMFSIDEGTIIGLSKESTHTGTTFSAGALAGCTIIGDNHPDATNLVSNFNTSLKIPYSSSAAASPPTLTVDGQIAIWHDSTNDKEYIIIMSDGETVKVELT